MATEKEKKNENAFLDKSMGELLEYMNAANILCEHYDNEARANTGQYYGGEEETYAEAMEQFSKYFALKNKILKEIEKRVDSIC